jgi:hypothetical protein
MKKNTLFLSAGITTFILVILAGLLLKVRPAGLAAPVAPVVPTAVATQAPTDTLQPAPTVTTATVPTVAGVITPQEAVFIASNALGNTQVYSVDSETRYGLDVYKVTFSSGHIVYVSPSGVILAIISPQTAVIQPTIDPASDNSPNKPKEPENPAPPPPAEGDDDSGDD